MTRTLSAFALGIVGIGAWIVSTSAQQPTRVDVLILFRDAPGQSGRAAVQAAGGTIKYSYNLVPAIAASLPAQAVAALANNPRIEVIEPDGIATINDDELDNTWGVKRIGAGAAHDATPPNTGAGIKVAVIDTGINYRHADLAANYKGGYDFVNGDNDPLDDNGHGTHVSGTIAASNNEAGVVGVAPNAHLYGVKVLSASGSGSYSNIIAGVEWATNNGMQVTNNSYSGTGASATLELAFATAQARGVVSVAAASNTGNCAGTGDNVGYPGRYSTVIAVAATDSADARACFSSTGPAVEIAAPGVQINSTVLNGGYGSNWNGTSMASPHVAGAAALLLYRGVTDSNSNGRMNDEVRNILALSAVDLGAIGRDPLFGFGRVDVPAALAMTSVPAAVAVTSISYELGTGRFNKDLFVTASTAYKPAVPQPGVAVSLTITLNNGFYKSVTGTTDSSGNVEIQIKNAPAGTYRATVTAASVGGLTWDLLTPANSFVKK